MLAATPALPVMLAVVLADNLASGGVFAVALPVLPHRRFGTSGYGLVLATLAAGAVAGATLGAWIRSRRPAVTSPASYDAWRTLLRESRPRFEFTDSPFRHSLPMALAFAASASRPVAVLTDPLHPVADECANVVAHRTAGSCDMVRVHLKDRPLFATAVVVWSGDLPRDLQQVLFDTADPGIVLAPAPTAVAS